MKLVSLIRPVYLLQIILILLMAGCQRELPPTPLPPEAPKVQTQPELGEVFATDSMQAIPWSEAPVNLFQEQKLDTWADALMQSAVYYRRIKPDKVIFDGSPPVTADKMAKACTELAQLARNGEMKQLQEVLQNRFQLLRSVGYKRGDVLVTGYYEPLLHGSLTRSKRYFYPIYRRPPDMLHDDQGTYRLVKGKRARYFSRSQIDDRLINKPYSDKQTGALANRGLELVWVDDPIVAFFLHIQGSGRVVLENGQMMRIGYAATNGHAYVAIGRILIEEGKLTAQEMTMPRLRQWLIDNPKENQRLFFANQSYVFFHELKGDPVGNINVPLTPDRSIATDHRLFPKGAPAIITTTLPVLAPDGKTVTGWRPEDRFVVNQDTGGAIRGTGRVDLFFGFGKHVDIAAGVMKQNRSKLYFIAPRPDKP
ncbi:MAG: MltA domain-containing protein [Magnetococcus sp. YQC-5]